MTFDKRILFLLPILLLAGLLRFWGLTSRPPGLYWDEASIAYNAYSIFLTGKSEYGAAHPFWFKAFGEYKLPTYIYTTSFFFYLTDNPDLAVRLPSALAGTLSSLAIYFLVQEIFSTSKHPKYLPFISSFVFAISPWSIQFSRAGFEANLALLFIILGFGLYLRSLRHPSYVYYFTSQVFLLLSMCTYNSARLFTPTLFIAINLLYLKKAKKSIKQLITTTLLLTLFFPSLIVEQFNPLSFIRASSTTYLGKESIMQSASTLIKEYSYNFDFNYLFFQGDQIGRHSTKKLGMMHFFELPLTILGIYNLWRLKDKRTKLLITSWLFLGPLPAAITIPNPHALRSLNTLPAWTIITSLGYLSLLTPIKRQEFSWPIKVIYTISIFVVISYHLLLFSTEYWFRYSTTTAMDWSDGNKQAVEIIKQNQTQYDTIYLTKELPLIYLALYLPIPPQTYSSLTDFSPENGIKIGNIQYINYGREITNSVKAKSLAITPTWQPPPEDQVENQNFKTIKMLNKDILYYVWEADATP